MPHISLHMLGPFRASLDDKPLEGFRTNKVQALLVYLAAEPGPQDRETLMALLWPGLPERSARANLRQVIYLLRQAIPDDGEDDVSASVLTANRKAIQLNPDAGLQVDVLQFDDHINSTQNHDHTDLMTCPNCREDLERAASLYRGNFLVDFFLDDSVAFEDWAQAKREYFRRRVLDALETLTTIAIYQNAYPEARSYAQRQLEIDDLRESAYRQLMEILALSGQKEEALTQYEACKRVLAEELGMAPSAKTTEVYEKIKSGDLAFDAPLVQAVRGYELLEEIGAGAYGSIHLAVQPAVDREVAVKVILRKYANNPEFIRRFEAEAQTIAHLEHPHIVPLYDYWRDPDGAYLVMRYLRGGSLLQALEPGPWNPEAAVKMLDQMASALHTAHQQGIVHRDIKPANILLDEAGNAYLSDFGIAKDLTGDVQFTDDGAVIGTPDYISPEQITSQQISPQTDIYSLGMVLYETLTGEKPFPDTSISNLIIKHLNEPAPLVINSRPDMPSGFDEIIQRATAKDPADRYSDALEMVEALRSTVQGLEAFVEIGDPIMMPLVDEVYNPYKGLRAFQEADADDFFGREALVNQLLDRLENPANSRFLALVGPSGSGKSSVVKAGVIPALRAGTLPGSEKWFVTEMVPGSNPLKELENALWSVAVDPPPSLVEPMQRDTRGMLRTIRRILPNEDGAQLLLVIDQFEELFTLVDDEDQRDFFIDSLLAALQAPRSPLRVVVTLRADFYDRPLGVQSLGQLLKDNTEIILPLSAEELSWAVREPARRMGVGLEEGLAEAVVADVTDQPGSLPLLQYAMTELFERRQDDRMWQATYEQIGGASGALASRAEEIFEGLDNDGQEASRQLFLRLVTLGEGAGDTRRRVLRTELEAIEMSIVADNNNRNSVIDKYGAARLLTFDYDPVTRSPTAEVAHEALLREWPRLRSWLENSRSDVRFQRLLAGAAAEWEATGRDPGFLLRGSRLNQFAGWAAASDLSLTGDESAFLKASIAARDARLAEEEARRQRELETAQELAETESARAEEQAQAANRLRRRAVFLAGALVIAALLAIAAVFFARQSNENAITAENNAFESQENADLAATRAVEAQENADLAATRAVEAQTEANIRATAEAVAIEERQTAEGARQEEERQRGIAEEQTRLTRSRELAALALNALETDPQLSLLLGLEAMSVADTRQAQSALHEVIPNARMLLFMDDFPDRIRRTDISPDGELIVVATRDGTIQIRDFASGNILQTITYEDGVYPYFAFHPDGSQMATINWLGTLQDPQPAGVTIWDLDSGEALLSIEEETLLDAVNWSPDGQRLAAMARMGGRPDVFVWDAESGEELLTISGEEDEYFDPRPLLNIVFSPDGSQLATASHLGNVFIYDAFTGELVTTIENDVPEFPSSVEHVAFNPSGEKLAVSGFAGDFFMWDLATETLDYKLRTGIGVGSSQFSQDGTKIITGADDGASILNAETGETLLKLPLLALGPDYNFTPNGERMLSAGAVKVTVWDITPGYEIRTLTPTSQHGSYRSGLSPDGTRLVTVDNFGEVFAWDALTGDLLWRAEGHDDWTGALDFSPDGESVATGSDDGTIAIWNLETGDQVLKWQAQDDWVNLLQYSPDGKLLASGNQDATAKVFDPVDGSLNQTITIEGGVWALDFDASGERLGAATYNNPSKMTVWELDSGEKIFELAGPENGQGINSLVFDPENRWLAAIDGTGIINIWDPENGELMHSIQSRHINALPTLAVSPDGNRLASVGYDGLAQIWDPMEGELLLDIPLEDYALRVGFSPDGRQLWAGTSREHERFFTLDSEELISLAEERLIREWTVEECKQFNIESCAVEGE